MTQKQGMGSKPMVEEKRFSRSLKSLFSDKETVDLARQISNAHRELKESQGEFDSVKSQYSSQLKRVQAEIDLLAEKINTGWEMRKVECRELKDFNTGNVYVIRVDTDELVEERPMSMEERQMGLFPETEGVVAAGPDPRPSGEPGVEGAEATPQPPLDTLPEDINVFYVGEQKKTKFPE